MTRKSEEPIRTSRLKKWSKELGLMMIVVVAISLLMDRYYSADMPDGDAPPIVATALSGETIDVIKASLEKPVIVYFWATWCGACRWVSPTINYFADQHTVVSVALSSGQDERVRQYMQAKQYQFSVLNDSTGHISRDWNIAVTPTIVIIKDGKIKSIATGITSPVGLWLRTLFA